MADLGQNAHAVAGFAFGILTGPMLQMFHNFQGIIQCTVTFPAVNIHNRANAAVVMFQFRDVESGFALGKIFHGNVSSPCK